MIGHFVSGLCDGEICSVCCNVRRVGIDATHKVGEEIPHDEPNQELFPGFEVADRHNFTAYVCCEHFRMIMGGAVFCPALVQRVVGTP